MRAQRGKRSIAIDWDEIHRRLERGRQAIESLDGGDREQQERILRERAAAMANSASRARQAAAPWQGIEVLVFQAAGERYAFETAHVAQVFPILPITPIPGVPDYVVGIMAVEGEVLSVIDLRSLLDLPLSRLAEPSAIIVLKGETLEFGVLAEEIIGIERYPAEALECALPTLADKQKTYLRGVSADRTAILDVQQLLSDPRLAVDAG